MSIPPYNVTCKQGVMNIDGSERRGELLKALRATMTAAPLTVKSLSELLHVSVRTVHYDLDILEDELAASGVRICRKARKGVWLEQDTEGSKQPLLQTEFLSPKARRDYIIIELLSDGWQSMDDIAEKLAISRGTLLLDLKDVQETIEARGLIYDSKRGAGIRITGDEQTIRDMYIHIFAKADYDFRAGKSQQVPAHAAQEPFRAYTRDLPVKEIAARFLAIMQKHGILENDNSTNRMICALAVQLQRLREEKPLVSTDKVRFLGGEGTGLTKLATEIAQQMASYHAGVTSPGEIQYLIRELLHSRIYLFADNADDSRPKDVNIHALQLARKFVEQAQVWLGDIYQDDDELIYNLAMHLQPAIERARFGIVLTNPLLGQIQEQYRSLYMVAHKAADKITEELSISFTEDEIGYLTIHLGAAVERKRLMQKQKLSVLLVCGNGVGTANLLAMTLKNHLPYISIRQIVSLYKLNEEKLADIDLVISTVPLELKSVALLRVSPIATAEEIKVIESQIAYFYNKKFAASDLIAKVQQPLGLKELLQPDMIELDSEAHSWDEAVRSAGEILVRSGAVSNNYVERMVSCVREMGPYIVVCPGVAMPHARYEDGVSRVAISFLRLKEPVIFGTAEEAKPVEMLFAFSTTDEKAHLQLLQDLWLVFNDRATLQKLQKAGSKEEILHCLDNFPGSAPIEP